MGNRNLAGAEARLFQEGACSLVDTIMNDHDELEIDTEVGVAFFDDLSYQQQLLMLEAVTYALTGSSDVVPAHTALNEATIAAVFEHIRHEVEAETELESGNKCFTFRKLLAEAVGGDEVDEYGAPDFKSNDIDMWSAMAERALDRIAWDRDWEDFEFSIGDRARETLGETLGTDYFSAKLPSPDQIPVKNILRGFAYLRDELEQSDKNGTIT